MNAFVSDDHQPTRDRVSRLLEAEGFTVRRFATADSAAAALSEPDCAVDLVVTDVQMPGEMDGVDLAAMLTATRPNLPVVVMSSDPHELERTTALGLDVPTLDKPFLAEMLIDAVADARARRSRSRKVRLPNGATDRLPGFVADPRPVLAAMFAEAAATGHPHVGSEHVALAALERPRRVRRDRDPRQAGSRPVSGPRSWRAAPPRHRTVSTASVGSPSAPRRWWRSLPSSRASTRRRRSVPATSSRRSLGRPTPWPGWA